MSVIANALCVTVACGLLFGTTSASYSAEAITRCSKVFQEQSVDIQDLNNNAIAFLYGKNKDPNELRKSVQKIHMVIYGGPVGNNNCTPWMLVEGQDKSRSFDLKGWNFAEFSEVP